MWFGLKLIWFLLDKTALFDNFYTQVLTLRFFHDDQIPFWLRSFDLYGLYVYIFIHLVIAIWMKKITEIYTTNKKATEEIEAIILDMYEQAKNICIVYLSFALAVVLFASTYSLDPILINNSIEYFQNLVETHQGGNRSSGNNQIAEL